MNNNFMMNYKEAAINIAFLTIIMTSGICSSSLNIKRKNENNKNHNKQKNILETFEKNDYAAWRAQVKKNTDLINVVREREFAKFVEARNAARQGLYDRSIAISAALELELKEKLSYVLSIA